MQDNDTIKKSYILHYILRPDFKNEEELHAQKTQISAKVEAAGGEIEAAVCQENVRRLAYPIRKEERGFVCETVFKIETGKISELQDSLRIEPGILRYMVETRRQMQVMERRRKPRREQVTLVPEAAQEKPKVQEAEKREKISIEELDKKLDEIIKNI